MSTPARAGPTTRALLTTTPLRLTALARSSGGTRRLTRGWRAGEAVIWTHPPAPPTATTPGPTRAPAPEGTNRAAALGWGRRLGPWDRPGLGHGGQSVTVHRTSATRVQRRPSVTRRDGRSPTRPGQKRLTY